MRSELDGLLQATGHNCAAFITAWNPMCQALDATKNLQRQRKLIAQLDQLGLVYFRGIGQHPTKGWPGEDSLLVTNLQEQAARSLAKNFGQLAFVWAAQGQEVRLIETNESFGKQ